MIRGTRALGSTGRAFRAFGRLALGRLALGSLAFGALAAFAAACAGPGSLPAPADTVNDPSAALAVQLTLDKAQYPPAESITAVLTLRNASDAPVVVEFSSGQRFDLQILDASGQSVWTWSADKGFIQALGQETVLARSQLEYRERFAAPSRPGTYTVRGDITAMGRSLQSTVQITVRP